VKLGDVIVQVKDRLSAGGKHPDVYVPGGSINRLSFAVSEWLPADDGLMGPAFHMIARPGDVLYKSRVPHGVAVADRVGICANTTYVLRTRDEHVLCQRLIPYVLTTVAFLEHESLNDKGSTNLYLNFSDIAKYEFALPPIDEQQRLVALLSHSGHLVRRTQDAITKLDCLLASLVTAWFEYWQAHGRMRKVSEFGELTMGRQRAPKYEQGTNPVPYLRVANIGVLQLHISSPPSMDFSTQEVARYRLRRGDVLITEGDIVSAANVGRAAVFETGPNPCCFQNTLIRLRPSGGVDPYFVVAMLEGARIAGVLAAAAGTTTVSHLGLKKLSGVKLPMAPPDEQAFMSRRLREAIALRQQLQGHLELAVSATRNIRADVGL
jgi:type I restriction enzyme S subunit